MAVQVEEMQQVAVRLRRDVYDRLDRYRNKTRISKTATIEQAIIEQNEQCAEQPPRLYRGPYYPEQQPQENQEDTSPLSC